MNLSLYRQIVGFFSAITVAFALAILWGWKQGVSPFLGQHCRFEPSCSDYAAIAFRQHGFLIGSFLSAKRVCKCNALFEGGLDPVPQRCYCARSPGSN